MANPDIVYEFDTAYNEAYYAWNPFYPEAETDLRFFLGDQWDYSEKQYLFSQGRNAYVFNRTRPIVNLLTGHQRQNRLSSVAVPREPNDQANSDIRTQLLLYSMNRDDVQHTISDCYQYGSLITGMNLASVWMDYVDDPVDGEIKVTREPYSGFILDPYFTKRDLSDCNYLMRRRYISPESAAALLPGQEDEVYSLWRMGWDRDDKFTWLPYQRQPNGQTLMAYNEYWLRKFRNYPMFVNQDSGEWFWSPTEDKKQIELTLALYPQLKKVMKPKRYIERHIILNNFHMRTDINPQGLDIYPFVLFTGIFAPESDDWSLKCQSMIRPIRDPQKEANRRRSQICDILDTNINSGWIATEGTVINPQSLFQASCGKVIWKDQDAPPGSLERIQPAQVSSGFFQAQETFDKDIMDIFGLSGANFGQLESANESGVMMQLRQSASLVNIQETLDNLRNAQKQVASIVTRLQSNWSEEKISRITGMTIPPDFYEKDATKYDIVIQEGLNTDTQRQMFFRQMIDLKQLGEPIPPGFLAKIAPIQGKTEYMQALQEWEDGQQKAQEEQRKLQLRQLESQEMLNKSRAISDLAMSKERFTRAVANLGLEDERASEAIQNRAQAVLDRARAVKELESMDEARLQRLLALALQLEEYNQSQEEEIKEDDVQITQESTSQEVLNEEARQQGQDGRVPGNEGL